MSTVLYANGYQANKGRMVVWHRWRQEGNVPVPQQRVSWEWGGVSGNVSDPIILKHKVNVWISAVLNYCKGLICNKHTPSQPPHSTEITSCLSIHQRVKKPKTRKTSLLIKSFSCCRTYPLASSKSVWTRKLPISTETEK